ncbi:ABC transporter ATP-binding protein [Nitrosomonas sp. JL21]|uniref:ribosomal protection-like ABC-F family protein n=1 Tax=Nitrosomonas sp. JL21 TaxID=153949 RepID=UPI00136EDEDC|nr:ABC-F family ATP-binding cassette domain-containing protein [Nitrosomonas sp. JL21]MBL8497178.1 ABC-F family ATP-binding cassette domain-containing protein [Nitrosomonas sp.]MXS76648.1 ABC transporter ATP-binding protein [Nitrosomonas sp. JL21]
MLNIQTLAYLQSGIPLLENCNLQIFVNQRIGLVGTNGSGKSTLFQLIRKSIKPDSGDINLQAGKTIAFVEQEIRNSNQAIIEFVLDGDVELRKLEKILAQADHTEAWFEAQQRYELIEGYTARARAAQFLNGLGFAQTMLDYPVNNFSGGWRMRLNLARALMHRADLLLLDEPTNHLDLEAIIWLEQYLSRYPGSLIVVSHDREFLNACVNRIAHLNNRKIDVYAGNYDEFERARAERLMQQTQAWQQQQRKIAHMEDFVRRFHAKASKAKQAQSRIKALERLVRIAPIYAEDGHFELLIEAPERSPEVLLRIKSMRFGYGQNLLFQDVHQVIQAGTRVALLGPNGAGKSTLIKLLVGELQPAAGQLEWASNIRIGYFAQHQLENLDGEATPLQHIQKLAPSHTELDLRKFLGRFGLGSDRENRPVGSFSGGEKSRLALALLAWQKPHVLLLDEPTNHLDLDMRDALVMALEAYPGAVVLVSHDRNLVRAVADELWLVADGKVQAFEGDLEDYKNWVEARNNNKTAEPKVSAQKSPRNLSDKTNKKTLLSKQSKIEIAISIAQKELAEINRQLADPATYMSCSRSQINQLSALNSELTQKVAELEENWLELEMSLEK